jgi:hypothetical protein
MGSFKKEILIKDSEDKTKMIYKKKNQIFCISKCNCALKGKKEDLEDDSV